MNKLDEALSAEKMYQESKCENHIVLFEFHSKYGEYPHTVVGNAASAYSELLKYAPQIKVLVEAVSQREKLRAWRVPFELFTTQTCRGFARYACNNCEKCNYIRRNPKPNALGYVDLAKIFICSPTLKEIHDNLTKWEE